MIKNIYINYAREQDSKHHFMIIIGESGSFIYLVRHIVIYICND